MREFCFRAWDTKNKMWLEEKLACLRMDGEIFWSNIKENNIIKCSLKNIKIMQYTGLKDKNGKRIFEGDIANWDGNFDYNGVVKFGEYWADGEDYYASYAYGFYVEAFTNKENTQTISNKYEVIGNIYENKNLNFSGILL